MTDAGPVKGMEPLPCLVTGLDALERADLRHRIERLVDRIMSGPGVTKSFSGAIGGMRDRHGSILLNQNVSTLSIEASAWEGMGSLVLTMPMLAAGGDRPAVASKLTQQDLLRLLMTWLGFLDTTPTSGNTDVRPGESNFARLAVLVTALIKAMNPEAGPTSFITVIPAAAWPEEGHIHATAHVARISSGSKPILEKELERRLLSLHPGVVIERNQGNRTFRMGHAPPVVFPIGDVGPIAIMRALADLQVQTIRKPVLKAGLALR
jgi:hypothetical protein